MCKIFAIFLIIIIYLYNASIQYRLMCSIALMVNITWCFNVSNLIFKLSEFNTLFQHVSTECGSMLRFWGLHYIIRVFVIVWDCELNNIVYLHVYPTAYKSNNINRICMSISPDMYVNMSRICMSISPGYVCQYVPHMYVNMSRICMSICPGYVCLYLPDMYVNISRICMSICPAYVCQYVPDMYVNMSRICMSICPGYVCQYVHIAILCYDSVQHNYYTL